MAERACTSCGAPADPRLKFCRECGSRVEDDPEDAAPAAAPGDSGDRTLVGAAPRNPAAAAAPAAPEQGGGGDATMIGVSPVRPKAKPPAPAPAAAPAADPFKTVVTGGAAPEREPPTDTIPEGSGDETVISAGIRATARAASAPVPPPPPVAAVPAAPAPAEPPTADPEPPRARPPAPAPDPAEAEPEPVTDDFDLGDDESGSTLAQPAPPPDLAPPRSPPAAGRYPTAPSTIVEPPAPPPVAGGAAASPLPAGAVRLDHWSPRVKGDLVTLVKPETLVGRDRGDLQYADDNYLSKKHARFHRDEQGRLCVEDLGTLNGTFLRLRGPVKLEHRDVFFVGRHMFRFELLQYEEKDDRTIEGDPLTRVQGVQGTAPRARIVKRQDEGFRGLPFFFGTQRYVLGRSDGTHNFQRDDLMSRRHASLSYKDGEYWLEDLGSQNGTFLRLRGPRVMEPGDVIKMGDQYFKMA
jgi:pSer/pThr/pTyr-binding forkhead associated (FHA) protein